VLGVRAPGFWRRDGLLPALLAPLGALYGAITTRRAARPGWLAPVPVICCGNASAGGSGKTTLALDLGARLAARGLAVAFLTRGYGGRESGRVTGDDAARFGDEALLLAATAPTYAGADRAAGARLAVADGAQVLVMDDGLQNPSLAKTLSLLVIDGEQGFGNGRMIPAGPLRETVSAAARRCGAAVLIGEDRTGALAQLPPGLPVLRATLRAGPVQVAGPVLAFAGIGRPEKFAETLRAAGVTLTGLRGFPDHHRYRAAELQALRDQATALGARLVTTPKDAVRLPAALRQEIAVVGVALDWADPAALERLLAEAAP
jgi:tetraacyldisaccharide 4'-kinase